MVRHVVHALGRTAALPRTLLPGSTAGGGGVVGARLGESDLPAPTACILLRLAERGPSGLLAQATGDLATPILPKATIAGAELRVVMPHAPEYDATAGESQPAPARVYGWPERFTRRGTVWTPA